MRGDSKEDKEVSRVGWKLGSLDKDCGNEV